MRFIRLAPLLLTIAESAGAQSSSDLIASGDRDYVSMNAQSALAHYEQAAKLAPSTYEAFWKASRSAVDIGSYTNDKSRREALFASAEQYARTAV